MQTDDFSFKLPDELIAQEPIEGERDQCRLLSINRTNKSTQHLDFFEFPHLLQPNDVLVLNDSKVLPGRLLGKKAGSGGKVEVLLLRPRYDMRTDDSEAELWEVLISGRNMKAGTALEFGDDGNPRLRITTIERASEQTWFVEADVRGEEFRSAIETIGRIPIPPYIKHSPLDEQQLREEYQTVYAREEGSAAAPTAGLHFTQQMLNALTMEGIAIVPVTLHVGLGTFAPVKVDDLKQHQMHAEYATVSDESAKAINEARAEGRRIIAVGTTSVRTLESFMENGVLQSGSKWTDIFVTPGYTFQCVDALLTNFHLPRSTLLMLVSAFAGYELTMQAYQEAIEKKYRFYSFGDAMFIE